MARLDLRDATERAEYGLRNETVSQRPMKPFRRQKFSRAGLQSEILHAVEYGYNTRLDIARKLGLAKTPHLVAVIEQLVSDGLLFRYHGCAVNGVLMFFYSTDENRENPL